MTDFYPRLLISTGEPAGIGPDLCLTIAADAVAASLVAVADPALLQARATQLGLTVDIRVIDETDLAQTPKHEPGSLMVLPVRLREQCTTGELNRANSDYVLDMLRLCTSLCQRKLVHALVTAPVHKGIINDAGHEFSGHTELLAQLTGTPQVVMLLCTETLRVALATTHLPLSEVPAALNVEELQTTIRILREGLSTRFGIAQPRIAVCGLNPHAGENGHLGREEIEIIEPALASLRTAYDWTLIGPLPADTAFTPRQLAQCDAVLAMYHDQGLPVLKYAGFGNAVNVTLGLPLIRTSVDHGTALDLAGTGNIDTGSLSAALALAATCASNL